MSDTSPEPGTRKAAPDTPMWRALRRLHGPSGEVARPSPIPLTVLVRTLNEADRIEPCLRSAIALGGEVLVIDAGSTDSTVAICEGLGARVIHNPWQGFGPQRRFGEEQASHDMIFCLDADEIVTPAMAAELRGHFARGEPAKLFIVRKAMVLPHHDKPPPLPFCHELIYVYDRRVARTIPHPQWDKLEISTGDRPVTIRAPMWHFSYRDWFHAIDKGNKVARLAAESTDPRNRLALGLRLIGELPATFFKFYVLRRYMLAGMDGFIMAAVSAIGRFVRVAMLFEKATWSRREQGGRPR